MNKPRPRAVLWALLSLIPAFATGAGSDDASSSTPDPLDLLERMSRSVHYLNYEGNFVFFHDGVLDGMRIAHTEHDGYEREHVVTLTGVPHQVVRDNFTMTRFLPEK
ncbi:MAG: sigma-E factor regulatory protein RseB domain-containing protein, partial [Pseudomonadota bacterium]